jgi:hypothetical protein
MHGEVVKMGNWEKNEKVSKFDQFEKKCEFCNQNGSKWLIIIAP